MENKKYFAVTTKCGHVGRKYYLPVTFPVVAESGKEAARLGRDIPRVKHAHKDAILDVREISYEEYLILVDENNNNMYLKCENKQQQKSWCVNIKDLVLEDEHNKKLCYSKEKRKERVEYQQKKIKALLTSYKYDERAYAIA